MISITIDGLDDAGHRDGSVPRAATSAILAWPDEPGPDGGMPDAVARALARVLTGFGEVCFRIPDKPPVGSRAVDRIRPSRWSIRPWTVVASTRVDAVVELLQARWASGDEVAIVGAASDDRLLSLFGADSPGTVAHEPGEIICSALTDGTGLAMTTSDDVLLTKVLTAFRLACRDGGVLVVPGG